MSKQFLGKVALVTGGSRGIGAAAAITLAEKGANVVITYASAADKAAMVIKKIKEKGVEGASLQVDLGDANQVERLIQTVINRWGRLDILINNAGIFSVGSVGKENNLNELERQYAVNIGGVVIAIRAASQVMSECGRIINIGSSVGSRVGMPGVADYAATKAAIVGYTQGAAIDLASRNITVNVVQPGCIDTDMNPANSDQAPSFLKTIPLRRYGKPEEVAAAIVFLASEEASYITGTVLNVDGGYLA